jgi:hypothetical protein
VAGAQRCAGAGVSLDDYRLALEDVEEGDGFQALSPAEKFVLRLEVASRTYLEAEADDEQEAA